MSQQKLVIDPNTAITGFNYTYSKALVEELKVLRDKDQIFDYPQSQRGSATDYYIFLKAQAILRKLDEHFSYIFSAAGCFVVCEGRGTGMAAYESKIDDVVNCVEDFLKIFEEK